MPRDWVRPSALIAAVVAGACVIAAILAGLRLLRDVAEAQRWVTHTVEVQLQAERLRADLRALAATPARPASAPLAAGNDAAGRQRTSADVDRLAALVRDNPTQTERVARLRKAIDIRLRQLGQPGLRRGAAADDTTGFGTPDSAEIDQSIAEFQSVEARLLEQRRSILAHDLQLHTKALLMLGGVAGALLLAAIALAFKLVQARTRTASALERAAELAAARTRSQFFARQLLDVEEAERRALAHELHDDLAQRLAALKLNLQLARQESHTASGTLAAAIDIADQCVQQVRQRAVTLRPAHLDELGLEAALRSHVEEQARLSGLDAQVKIDIGAWQRPREWDAHVFRIVQEAVRNAITHGRARTVRVRLIAQPGRCTLSVDDDGRGLGDQPQPGLGLSHMRERTEMLGGNFSISSLPGAGARVQCIWESGR